jgi:hypothetical protein
MVAVNRNATSVRPSYERRGQSHVRRLAYVRDDIWIN